MLYKKIQLKNYKSFEDVTFSLASKNFGIKHSSILYGSNGSGKSTILESFATLYDLMQTKDITNTLDSLKERINDTRNIDIDDIDEVARYLSRGVSSVSTIYNKTLGTSPDKPIVIILEFEDNGYNGSYEIHLQDKLIVYEELKYLISKNKGCYFKIDSNGPYINEKVVLDKDAHNTLIKLINQSWGVHSFISILKNELRNYNNDFINAAFQNNLITLLQDFEKISYRICNTSNTIEGLSKTNSYLFTHLSEGYIKKTSEEELKNTEIILTRLMKLFIDDLIKAEYVVSGNNYYLSLTKLINGKEIDVIFSNESSGIKEFINYIPYVIKAINGEIVILDEYANHIHDTLSLSFLNKIIPLIKGQLIISTHSTILLNKLYEQYIDSFYFIKVVDTKRSILCITDIEEKLRKEYNYQKKYLNDKLYRAFRNDFEDSETADDFQNENELVSVFKELA